MTTFMTPDEIADDIFSKLSAPAKREVLSVRDAEDMIAFHHGVGTYVRNHYKLWDPDNPHTEVDAKPNAAGVIDDPLFPDQVSHAILMKVWEKVQEEAKL